MQREPSAPFPRSPSRATPARVAVPDPPARGAARPRHRREIDLRDAGHPTHVVDFHTGAEAAGGARGREGGGAGALDRARAAAAAAPPPPPPPRTRRARSRSRSRDLCRGRNYVLRPAVASRHRANARRQTAGSRRPPSRRSRYRDARAAAFARVVLVPDGPRGPRASVGLTSAGLAPVGVRAWSSAASSRA